MPYAINLWSRLLGWRMNNKDSSVNFILGISAMIFLTPHTFADEFPRLKYRSKGSVCACESGMGEAEIARGRQAREQQDQPPGNQASAKLEERKVVAQTEDNSMQLQRRKTDGEK